MMTCAEAARLMSNRLNHPLGIRARLALRLHLMLCVGCRRYARQLMFIREWLRSSANRDLHCEGYETMHLDPIARDRILSHLRELRSCDGPNGNGRHDR